MITVDMQGAKVMPVFKQVFSVIKTPPHNGWVVFHKALGSSKTVLQPKITGTPILRTVIREKIHIVTKWGPNKEVTPTPPSHTFPKKGKGGEGTGKGGCPG